MKKNILKIYTFTLVGMLFFSMSVFVSSVHAQEDAGYPCKPYNECISNSTDAATKVWIAHDSADGRASDCKSGTGRCISQTGIPLNVPIPTLQGGQIDSVASIDVYINVIFLWLLRIGGVIAALVIVWGGYTYLTSAGNQARTSQAKEILTGGIVGLALLFGSVAILSFINTRLVNNAPITVDVVQPQQVNLGFCKSSPQPADKSECGSAVKDTADNSNCISNWCLNSKVCVPATIAGPGLGLSGGTNGYGCVDASDLDVENVCEDDTLPHQCSYVATLAPAGETCAPDGHGSCAYGAILECPGGASDRVSCSSCASGSSSVLSNGVPSTRFAGHEEGSGSPSLIKLGFSSSWGSTNIQYYTLTCADPGVTQVAHDISITTGNRQQGDQETQTTATAICCQETDVDGNDVNNIYIK